MANVIFARPRWNYDSYVDLYRLIELSGYDLVFVDEIDPYSDNVYIVTILNGETQDGWLGASARIILFDCEWHLDGFPLPAGVNEIWTPDAWYSQQLQQRYGLPAYYVPLGSHPALNPCPEQHETPLYDAALMAYMGPMRRQQVADELRQRGLKLAPNGWGEVRHMTLLQSSSMLHIHQHDGIPAIAAQRVALAASYKLPVITETLANSGIFNHTHLLSSDHANLAAFAETWLRRNDAHGLAEYGRNLHYLLCEKHPFRQCVDAAL